MKRALLSVSDKTGIVAFAKALIELGYEIISTGGTAQLLREHSIQVTGVSEVTNFPEILDGRVKTLHPMIHGGLLAVTDRAEHQEQLKQKRIQPIDLVVVNLYPFKETISKKDVTYGDAIENIDIGGPAMLRSAAKNHAFVTALVDAEDYSIVLEEMNTVGVVSFETRRRLAAKVFRHTAAYDALVAAYLTEQTGEKWPEQYTVTFEKAQDVRYGENPHQQAAFYKQPLVAEGTLATIEQLNGKELSYNNINDINAAVQISREFDEPAVVVVKHTNPCGIGIGDTILTAFQKAYEADPISIFGGIVVLNDVVDVETAKKINEIFLEVVMAPDYDEEALQMLQVKKNLRLLKMGFGKGKDQSTLSLSSVSGGLLVQDEDTKQLEVEDLSVVTQRQPTAEEIEQLLFAWKVVKHVKSNAIVLVKENQTIGIGAGQMNRVGSARIAIEQAAEKSKGSIMASDAFFPMKDTIQEAIKAGITAVIQPGGSIRDQESIDEANKHGIAMIFTGVRHFKH